MSPEEPIASELFARFLGRSQADFEAFCGEHPEQAGELRRLEAEHRALLEVKGQQGLSGTLTEEIRRQYGDQADPRVSLDGEGGPSDLQSDLVQRLGGREGGFGRYQMKGEVGRGGQGAVIRVWDRDLRRSLAMKVLLGQQDSALPKPPADGPGGGPGRPPQVDSKKLGRFLEEAQVTGQLDHPGIVPVHELGLDPHGALYFTMKLVNGESLRAVFQKVRAGDPDWGLMRALTVMLKVCEAVSYAHSKGVVHRDLKPGNVMVGRFGEVYVMDWGLARVLDGEERKDIRINPEPASVTGVQSERRDRASQDPGSPLVTMEGDVVGTPAFMAPEQARGELERVGPLSDVYSIGAMLYELLTGQMPYVAPRARLNNHAIWGMVQSGPPARIERIAKGVPAELVAICEKAMAREPEDRYASAAALREDLQAFVGGRVVQAYRTGAVVEFKKWVQRNRALALSSVVAVALLVVALVVLTIQAGMRAQLTREQETSLHMATEVRRQGYVANLRAAAWSFEAEAYAEARRRLAACPEELQHWEWRHLALRLDQSIRTWQAHGSAVTALLFDPEGRRLFSASTDGRVFAWDPLEGARRLTFETAMGEAAGEVALPVLSLALSGGRDARVTGVGGGHLRTWDGLGVQVGSAVVGGPSLVHAAVPGTALVVLAGYKSSSGGSNLSLVGPDGKSLWSRAVEDGVPVVKVSPDGEQILVGGRGRAYLYDRGTGNMLASRPVQRAVTSAAFHPAGAGLAIGLEDGALESWAIQREGGRTRIVARPFELDAGSTVEALAFSPDGLLLVVGLRSGRLAVASTRTLRGQRDLLGHTSAIRSIAFAPGGELFASGGQDGSVRIWLGARSSYLSEFDVVRDETVAAVAVSADGTRVVASGPGAVRIWDAHDARPIAGFEPEASAFDPTTNRLFLVTRGRASLVDAASGETLEELEQTLRGVRLADLAPGARRAALALEDGSVELQPMDHDSVRAVQPGGLLHAQFLRFSPDGRRLVAANSHELVAFDSARAAPLRGHRLPAEDAGFFRVACDPRGEYAAFSTYAKVGDDVNHSGRLAVLHLERGELRLLVDSEPVFAKDFLVTPVAIAFSPDGERLACGFNDGSLRLWQRDTWAVTVMQGPALDWRTITFSPEGDRIWAWTEQSTGIGVFDARHGEWLFTLPVSEGNLLDVAYDPVHDRLLVTTGARKKLLSLDGSLEEARALWEAVAARERVDQEIETRLTTLLVADASAELDAASELDPKLRQELLRRLAWVGDPPAWELTAAAWEVVNPDGPRSGPLELALRWARAAAKLEPERAEYHETLAWALVLNDQFSEGEAASLRALELAPDAELRDYRESLERLRREIEQRRRDRR